MARFSDLVTCLCRFPASGADRVVRAGEVRHAEATHEEHAGAARRNEREAATNGGGIHRTDLTNGTHYFLHTRSHKI